MHGPSPAAGSLPNSASKLPCDCWEEQQGRSLPRPVVLAGDITQPDFGLSPEQIKWTAENCDGMLHNAASLSFVTTGRDAEPWRSNVVGTQNALEFCRQADIKEVLPRLDRLRAGIRHGRAYEHELDVGQQFGNCYERARSKPRSWSATPSTWIRHVLPPRNHHRRQRHRMTTTYHNFYVAVNRPRQVLVRSQDQEGRDGLAVANQVHFNMNGNERKHLVPVDWVSAVMAHIVDSPEHHGKTYHLTPRVPLTMRLIRDVLEAEVGFYGVEFYGAESAARTLQRTRNMFLPAHGGLQLVLAGRSAVRQRPTRWLRLRTCPSDRRTDDAAAPDPSCDPEQVQLERPCGRAAPVRSGV